MFPRWEAFWTSLKSHNVHSACPKHCCLSSVTCFLRKWMVCSSVCAVAVSLADRLLYGLCWLHDNEYVWTSAHAFTFSFSKSGFYMVETWTAVSCCVMMACTGNFWATFSAVAIIRPLFIICSRMPVHKYFSQNFIGVCMWVVGERDSSHNPYFSFRN